MPNERANFIVSTVHRGRDEVSSLWHQVKSSPTYVLIVLTGAIVWAFAIAWLVLPPHH